MRRMLRGSCLFFDGTPDREKLLSNGWVERDWYYNKDWEGLRLSLQLYDGQTAAVISSNDDRMDFDLVMQAYGLMRDEM